VAAGDAQPLPPVIGPLELKAALAAASTPPLRLIDVRAPEDYRSGHIDGAVPFDMINANRTQPPVAGLLPAPEQFNRAMSAIGLEPGQPAVIYDDSGGASAARLAWTLKAFGHPAVSLLDGGVHAWRAEGLPLTREFNPPAPTDYRGRLNADVIADRDYILQHLADDTTRLLDARSPAEYRGEDRRSQRGGHIPGAVNLDWTQTKEPDGVRFRSPGELEALLTQRGIDRDKEIICYCQSHQRSAVLCILLESLGYQRVKGYPGAWSDWGNRPDTPIETGE
jgi:thiosulfate/3-mercaptopyruvate sulfurtransferase